MIRRLVLAAALLLFLSICFMLLGLNQGNRQLKDQAIDSRSAGFYPQKLPEPLAWPGLLRPATVHEAVPWQDFMPLTEAEKSAFKEVEDHIQKFKSWGIMDEEALAGVRQTLFRIGDRAIAELARTLSQFSKETVRDKETAKKVIRDIDTFAYFVNVHSPLAHKMLRYLARRPVEWDESGLLIESVEATISFEMFNCYARHHPQEALEFIKSIKKPYRVAYFTHYAYGRKLAGKSMDEIDQELQLAFESPLHALN